MALHRLSSVTIGVPNVEQTRAYYTDFGLTPQPDGWLATGDGGRQLNIVSAPTRRLVELRIGADDTDDLRRTAERLRRAGIAAHTAPSTITAVEQVTGVRAVVALYTDQ